MTPAELIEAFDTLADAPDGIARLRELVLQLAVRGQLVPQDPKDEPASVLLERIAKEKARLIKEGKIRKEKPLPPIKPEEVPYELPRTWAWTRLGKLLARISNGITSKQSKTPLGIPVTRIETISTGEVSTDRIGFVQEELDQDKLDFYRLRPGDILLSHINSVPHLGKTAHVGVLPASLFHGTNLLLLRTESHWMNSAYVHHHIQALRSAGVFAGMAKQAIQQASVNQTDVQSLLFGLPPLAEQHRIVAKVDELMGLLDRLEEAKAKRDETRAALRDAALAALRDANDAEEVQAAWSRIAENMDDLFTAPADVAPLRQTILQLAVRGRLVPQDPTDEPASALLERIAKEKARLIKEGKIRKEKPLPPIKREEVPFELPAGWAAATFPHITVWAIGCGFPTQWQGQEGLPFMFCKVSDMNRPGNERYIRTTAHTIDDRIRKEIRAKVHPAATVVFPKIGGAIATNKRRQLVAPTAIDNNCLGLTPLAPLDPDWLFLFTTSVDLTTYQSGTAVPALSQGTLEEIAFGLPPLAEQRRIVAKVDELMGLLDQLEVRLGGVGEAHAAFASAAVHHVEVPTGSARAA